MKITDMLLTPNKYSRPQKPLTSVNGVVWHWVANANSSATANRNFFENRKFGKTNYGSAHYIIDLDGTIIRCLPEKEMAYHVGSVTYTKNALAELGSYPNATTIGIECTHIDNDGNMTDATRKALIELTADILKRYKLTADDIWLHKEVVGWKECHKYYCCNQAEYKKDKEAVGAILNPKVPVKAPEPVKIADIIMVEADALGMYTIQKGDTLWGISKALDVSVDDIKKLNPSVNPSTLSVGQKIRVKESNVSEYAIAKGETLWGLANKFNTTVAKLEELNKGLKATALQVGAKILVPNAPKEQVVTSKPAPAPAPKPKPTPAPKPAHSHKFTKLGRAKGNVYSHTKPDFEASTRDEVVEGNARLEVCCEQNGLYYTNKGWVSTNYVDIVGDLKRIDLPNTTLNVGSRGSSVVQVQRALNQLKFNCGEEDGIYGIKVQDAMKRFQMVHDAYQVNGIYSHRVELKMEALLNK